ncbi:hypothetical protein AMTRI_Chr13g88890 [Amborella trichopoda]
MGGGLGAAAIALTVVLVVLFLVLVAELYYALVLKFKLTRVNVSHSTTNSNEEQQQQRERDHHSISVSLSSPNHQHPSLPKLFPGSVYAQGVLGGPRFLFTIKEDGREIEGVRERNFPPSSLSPTLSLLPSNLHFIGLLRPPSDAGDSSRASSAVEDRGACTVDDGRSCKVEDFVCISNPIYEVEASPEAECGSTTPFDTPVSSPSRLEEGSSSDSPPLTPMKLLSQNPSLSPRSTSDSGRSSPSW